jgi:MATE family multidrug resistance protein
LKTLRQHINETVKLAYPVVIGQFGYMLMQVVDSAMVGRVGVASLAASSIANGIFILILVLGIGVTYAASPLVAIAIGEEDIDECSSIFNQSFIINISFGIFLFVATYFSADVIRYLNQPKEVVRLAIPYTRILSVSLIPIMVFQTYKQFIEGLSFTRPAMVVTIIANLINAFACWVLIFGNLGFQRLGLNGAGLATLTSRTFMAIVIIIFVVSSSKFKKFKVGKLSLRFNLRIIKKLLVIGLPSGFQYFFEVGAFSFAAIMVGWISANALAAHQIALSIASITYMIVSGISSAAAIRVGNAVGIKSIPEIRKAGFTALFIGALFMFFSAGVFIIFRNILPLIYIKELPVIEIASSLIVIAAFFEIFDGIQCVAIGVLRGIADVKIPTIITFTSYWVIALPLGYLLAFYYNFGVQGIWIALSIGLVASATLLSIRFYIKSKKEINV